MEMLDLRMIRQDPDKVKAGLAAKGEATFSIDEVLALDERRRGLLTEVEQLKAKRNEVSEEIARLKREKQDAQSLIEEMREVSQRIKDYDDEVRDVSSKLQDLLLRISNLPHESVHVGSCEEENKKIRRWSDPIQFGLEHKAHGAIGVDIVILHL